MLNLNNGTMLLENSKIILSRTLSICKFKNDFPTSKIHAIHDMGNGYVWYRFIEEVFSGEPAIFTIGFAPNGNLCSITLCPGKNKFADWSEWSEGQMEKDKAYNDQWLSRVCHTTKPFEKYSWGTIGSYLDAKTGDSYIMIKFHDA